MAYKPSLSDLGTSDSYSPSLSDLPSEENTTQELLKMLPEQKVAQRQSLLQEEFGNPTSNPNFQNLSKEEQLARIKFAAFDPANQSPTGTFVPPGTYESEPARLTASTAATFAAPEIRGGGPILSSAINALGRIGMGTAGNLLYQAPNIQNADELKNILQQNISANALLEGGTLPFRAARSAAELYNPLNYTNNKLNQIKSDYQAARSAEQSFYNPVLNNYGKNSIDIDNYKNAFDTYKNDLGTKVKKLSDKLFDNPTVENAHKTQSQMFSEIKALSKHQPDAATLDRINALRESRTAINNDLIPSLRKMNPKAAENYIMGTNIHRDIVSPNFLNPTLANIVEGEVNHIAPQSLTNSIQSAIEKGRMPENHSLRNHLSDLEDIISRGRVMQTVLPGLAGSAIGQYLFPDHYGGILGGVAGLGGGTLLNKLAGNALTNFIQEPWTQKWTRRIAPAYYGLGRAGISYNGE